MTCAQCGGPIHWADLREARNRAILEARAEGATWAVIGRTFGMTEAGAWSAAKRYLRRKAGG